MANSQFTQPLRIIQQLIDETAGEPFRKELFKSSNNAFRAVKAVLTGLEITTILEGEQVPRVDNNEHNLDILNRAFTTFSDTLVTASFQKRLEVITKSFVPITELTAEYYTEEFGSLTAPALNNAANQTDKTQQDWVGFAFTKIRNEIFRPVLAEWQSMLGTATETEFLNRTLFLIKDKVVNQVQPPAHAFLQNHFRDMSQIFADGFNLVWVRYLRQTSTAERRDFCVHHESSLGGNPKHYHIEEVKNVWPQFEGGKWDGAIPGTDSNNILKNGGGYNCLHSFEYVLGSKVSKADRSRARNLLGPAIIL